MTKVRSRVPLIAASLLVITTTPLRVIADPSQGQNLFARRAACDLPGYVSVMPAQGPGLGDEGGAAVLNYVLKAFNLKTLQPSWPCFSATEVARINARYANLAAARPLNLRGEVFRAQ